MSQICNIKDSLTQPDFFEFAVSSTAMVYGSANFVRNITNNNPTIDISRGTNIAPGIWASADFYLPTAIFNYINLNEASSVVSYSNADAQILEDIVLRHEVYIHYKLEAADGITASNYTNNRELRCSLAKNTGTAYAPELFANQQPASSEHDYITLCGHISHTTGDVVRLKFSLVQDETGVASDTRITIFRISWNILGLK